MSSPRISLDSRPAFLGNRRARMDTMIQHDLRELLRYKDLLLNLVIRHLTVRYRRSMLGFCWSLLNPLLNTVVFTIVFATVFRFGMKDFIIYFLSGYQLWNFVSQSTVDAAHSILLNGQLFNKIYLPTSIFVYSVVLSGLINLGLALVPLFLLVLVIGKGLHPALVFLPLPLLFTLLFSLGVSLTLASTAVFFHDIINFYKIILMPWMYLTPIVYPLNIVPEKYLPLIKLNPMYYLVECFRQPIVAGTLPDVNLVLMAGGISLATLFVGYAIFHRLSDKFVYYV